MLADRASGILLHITSLPSKYGIGDVGPAAQTFVDFLVRAGQTYWQILPLNHTTPRAGHSPYNCFSAFAGNPLLISPELLHREGLLTAAELRDVPAFPVDRVDFPRVVPYKTGLLNAAWQRFARKTLPTDYEGFLQENAYWLEDFVTFVALRRHWRGKLWSDWPKEIRDRVPAALDAARVKLQPELAKQRFLQYIFYSQYLELKHTCSRQDIRIMGDVPIYVNYDSADVWSHPELFKLISARRPAFVAGVPPDYFSRTGQLWGNPVYNWRRHRETGFQWWIERLKHNLRLFDLMRIDHFRGLVAYWQVPARHKTAVRGRWVAAPSEAFFHTVLREVPSTSIFVEDLGHITAAVRKAIEQFGFPCMRVLQFGFGGDPAKNPHHPRNHVRNCLVYTGTHDNTTTRAWFERDITDLQRKNLFDWLGHEIAAPEAAWELIRLAEVSPARITVIPMQDVLGLPASARMNHPARKKGNWLWRMRPGQTTPALARRLREVAEVCGRI